MNNPRNPVGAARALAPLDHNVTTGAGTAAAAGSLHAAGAGAAAARRRDKKRYVVQDCNLDHHYHINSHIFWCPLFESWTTQEAAARSPRPTAQRQWRRHQCQQVRGFNSLVSQCLAEH